MKQTKYINDLSIRHVISKKERKKLQVVSISQKKYIISWSQIALKGRCISYHNKTRKKMCSVGALSK